MVTILQSTCTSQSIHFSLSLDFDEKCSKEDDWDVDMSTYYGYGRELCITQCMDLHKVFHTLEGHNDFIRIVYS